MQIATWLDTFRNAWINHDIDSVMTLFAPEVEYWETPFKKLQSIDEVRREWQSIVQQQDIQLETRLFNQRDGKYAVLWNLSYRNLDGITRVVAGTYLIELNTAGLCAYFYHTGESNG